MLKMKRFLIGLLACALVLGSLDAQAQNKKKSKKAKKTKQVEAPAAPSFLSLPANSNDCLFAIPLQMDKLYGPTTAPDGAGRIQEIVADKAHPHIFEREHNTVWYKIKVPYNGDLEIAIMQVSQWDDYDFLVYKNTGSYFSNQVMLNKINPVAVNMAGIDSAAMFAAIMKSGKGKTDASAPRPEGSRKKAVESDLPSFELTPDAKPTIGMFYEATDKMLTKNQTGKFIKSIPVRKDEEYYIVLDNRTLNGQGHSIKVSVHVDAYEPLVLFYDRKGKRYVDVNLMILERGGKGEERPIVQDQHYRGGKVKFVPGYSYLLYAKRDGYFSIYKEFNSWDLMMHDTIMLYDMERTERGSSFQIRDLNFESDEATLIGNYDSVLMDYLLMFRNHPEVNFLVKGYVQSYGVNAEADMLLSLDRAKAIKEWFVKNGIDAKRITTAGMTKNEIKRAAAAALNEKGGGFSNVKAELIITGKGDK